MAYCILILFRRFCLISYIKLNLMLENGMARLFSNVFSCGNFAERNIGYGLLTQTDTVHFLITVLPMRFLYNNFKIKDGQCITFFDEAILS